MADQSITDYTAATALARADLVEVVQDVATTPVNRKATLDVLDPGNVLTGDAGANADTTVAGTSSSAPNRRSTVYGASASAVNDDSVAVGHASSADDNGVAVGKSAEAGRAAVAVGYSADANNGIVAESVAVGADAEANLDSVAVGFGAVTGARFAVALGWGATANFQESIALGDVTTTATDQVMVGAKDIEITGTVKGLVLEDRTLGTRHRVYLDNGTLTIEAA